jgi:chemotaxis response regulator CheB
MPQAAIDTGGVDFVLKLEEIGPALVALVMHKPKL